MAHVALELRGADSSEPIQNAMAISAQCRLPEIFESHVTRCIAIKPASLPFAHVCWIDEERGLGPIPATNPVCFTTAVCPNRNIPLTVGIQRGRGKRQASQGSREPCLGVQSCEL